ncbi:MAG: hypothetical protein CSB34_04315 [Desulfobulbus propionicus]|nr:MAG: hypothetical protein CSB34_04315 [Desulfobulbus propionicus]
MSVIEKTVDTYRIILSQLHDIEQLLHGGHNIDLLMEKYREMVSNQNEAKKLDQEVLRILSIAHDQQNDSKIKDMLDLMQDIQHKNRQLAPKLQSIMAITREELKKISTGNTMMRRYHSNTDRTGGHISTAG